MINRDFVKYHLHQALHGAVAEENGDEDLARRLRAEVKLRLIDMSDEEIRELAKQTSPREWSVEVAYERYKQAAKELRATASEWVNDLVKKPRPGNEAGYERLILVIEDEATLRSELASCLTEAGFAVVSVPDYPETLLKLDEFRPDIVIMDMILPGRDAMETCHQLRTTFGIPVVLLGEDYSDEVWSRVMEADAKLYLVKPVRTRELIARVKAILRRHEWLAE